MKEIKMEKNEKKKIKEKIFLLCIAMINPMTTECYGLKCFGGQGIKKKKK